MTSIETLRAAEDLDTRSYGEHLMADQLRAVASAQAQSEAALRESEAARVALNVS